MNKSLEKCFLSTGADLDKRLFPVDEDVKTVCERTTGELATIGS